tara:strand:+ start:339 stop:866 length:528 start_codon:yes stop_codon:yes gene_type:complete
MELSLEEYTKTDVAQEISAAANEDIYRDSPFYGLKCLSSKSKGAKAEKLFKEYMKSLGHHVTNSLNTDHDCIVNGHKIEIKSSFLWKGTTNFRFQQIRPSQDYDFIVFLSFYPDNCAIHVCDKETARRNLEVQDENGFWIHNQHGGKRTNSGTFFIDCEPGQVPWMIRLGNQLNA